MTVPANAGERGRRVGVGVAGVDHDRQPDVAASSSWRSKSAALRVARREVVEVVEPRLPDRDRLRVLEQLARARRPASASAPPAWCGSIPSAAKTPSSRLGDRERRPARLDPRADRDDPRDADGSGALDEERGGLLAPVEVRVGVDHARSVTPRARRARGKSGAAASIPVRLAA